jgi:outer membrane protein insertion porin family
LFTVNIFAGLEEQYVGASQSIATRRAGTDLNLYIPRIVSPFRFKTNSGYVPKTKLNAGYEIFDRSSQYALTSIKTSYGYIFRDNMQSEHQLNIFTVTYVNPTGITPAYRQVLDSNITLKRSIERQFIIGPNYNFNYNSLAKPNHRMNNFYFNGNIDLSGNLLGLLTGADLNKGKEIRIFNTPFAQYARVELDFRHYLAFSKYNILASRITAGLGYAYGNSITMPFIKEFFAGGTNDLRAFRSRSLGPGSYYAGDRRRIPFLPDQPGDVKLEANAEYRAKLFSIVRWAFFVDAGNIWTVKPDSSRPGSVFNPSFVKNLAVGIGTGLRFDLDILVLRVDLAIPVREPWLPNGSKWVFHNLTDISNLVLNLAIGYPF